MEYVKYFWKYTDDDTPILIFAELDEERYSIRDISVFPDRHIEIQGEYISEEPYPQNEEINDMVDFKIFNISKDEFEKVWNSYQHKFYGSLEFPSL